MSRESYSQKKSRRIIFSRIEDEGSARKLHKSNETLKSSFQRKSVGHQYDHPNYSAATYERFAWH